MLHQIVIDYYGYEAFIFYDLSENIIDQELKKGNAVVIPAAGRKLGNPFFTQPGPLYHMLVIKGKTEDGRYITNDPGTRRGGDFIYDPQKLLSAVRNWDGDGPTGERVGLVLTK